jgi:large conductance mechanosensitive channel
MPPIGLVVGNVDFSDLHLVLKQAEGVVKPVTLNYGMFINNIINFAIVAFSMFLVIKTMNRFMKKQQAAPAIPTTKDCPQCLSTIPIKATRCAHCTSSL